MVLGIAEHRTHPYTVHPESCAPPKQVELKHCQVATLYFSRFFLLSSVSGQRHICLWLGPPEEGGKSFRTFPWNHAFLSRGWPPQGIHSFPLDSWALERLWRPNKVAMNIYESIFRWLSAYHIIYIIYIHNGSNETMLGFALSKSCVLKQHKKQQFSNSYQTHKQPYMSVSQNVMSSRGHDPARLQGYRFWGGPIAFAVNTSNPQFPRMGLNPGHTNLCLSSHEEATLRCHGSLKTSGFAFLSKNSDPKAYRSWSLLDLEIHQLPIE